MVTEVELNFPRFNARFQKLPSGQLQIFDAARKKFVLLTPEEWVRQHILHYIVQYKGVPLSAISVEKQLTLNGTKRRTDMVIYNTVLKPIVLIECKAPDVLITQQTIDQTLRYNLKLDVPYLFISNGKNHVSINVQQNKVLKEFPEYASIFK